MKANKIIDDDGDDDDDDDDDNDNDNNKLVKIVLSSRIYSSGN